MSTTGGTWVSVEILVVDDQPQATKKVTTLLQSLGLEVSVMGATVMAAEPDTLTGVTETVKHLQSVLDYD